MKMEDKPQKFKLNKDDWSWILKKYGNYSYWYSNKYKDFPDQYEMFFKFKKLVNKRIKDKEENDTCTNS